MATRRPPKNQRRFTSAAVEAKIAHVAATVKDPEIAWLFANCFPNTLDTTVSVDTLNGKPDTYVIRLAHGYWRAGGDTRCFDAEWLDAMRLIVSTFKAQQRKTGRGPYAFQRQTIWPWDTAAADGWGNPASWPSAAAWQTKWSATAAASSRMMRMCPA